MLNMHSMNVRKDNLINFVNIVNECCCVMDHDYVGEWLTNPNQSRFKYGFTNRLDR